MNFVQSLFDPRVINIGAAAGGQLAASQAQQQSDWARGMNDEVLASAKEASGRDFALSDITTASATDKWNRYRKLYQLVEDQTVKGAAGHDSQDWTKMAVGGNA